MKLDRVIAVRNDKTIYRDNDVCVKVFNENYSKADVLNEALNQSRIEETGLDIPKIKEITMVDGKWAIVSEYIKGKTLGLLMEENPDKKDEYLELFVNLQTEVHSKKAPLLNKLKDKMNYKICESDLSAVIRYDLHSRLETMERDTTICHGDFIPSNIIVAEDGTPYILDWSHATQGNAMADVARTYILFRLNGEDDTAEKYLDLYCEKSNMIRYDVKKWISIVAASQSVQGNSREREFLLSLVDVIDYR